MPLHRPPPPEVACKPSPGPSSPADLSADLAIDLRTLQRTVTFYRTYRHPPTLEGLSWAHYRILMQLQAPDERAFLTLPRPSHHIQLRQLPKKRIPRTQARPMLGHQSRNP